MILDVFVIGEPVPQGSLAQGAGGRMYWANSKRLRPWRKAMTDACQAFMPRNWGDGYDDAVRVELTFYHTRGASVKRRYKITAGDSDKLARAALDSLTDAKLYTDDSRVVELMVSKHYADDHEPGVIIRAWKLPQ